MTRLGFVGTGTITAHVLRGLKASDLSDWPVLLSPRNAGVAAELAASLPGVTVAADNQAVVDGSDLVVLAVRPQVAEAVVGPLRFRPGQRIISLIAGLPIATIRDWTGVAQVTRAIPLPFVEDRRDATPVFPPDPEAMALFDALGRALPVHDAGAFDVYAASSALMGTYFGVVEEAARWAEDKGLPEADARAYLASLFSNLGEVLRHSTASLPDLRDAHSTKGGLNEQVFAEFVAHGGAAALAAGLDSVLARLRR